MKWLAIKTAVCKSWLWLKEHWQFPILLLWTIFVFVFSRRNSEAMLEVMEAKKNSYRKQITILNEKHATEILKRDQLIDQYHEAVEKIEEDFKKKSKELTVKQKNTIKEIIIDSKGDPDAVKAEIENIFNFTYVD
tara:strand:- start:2695 stop:3099 length:405 start_codon:yes stop_codon:yes gene_type:complete